MPVGRLHHDAGIETQQMQNKFIRVLRLDFERSQNVRRKIPQIRRDNHVGTSPDCRRQHVPGAGIGKM